LHPGYQTDLMPAVGREGLSLRRAVEVKPGRERVSRSECFPRSRRREEKGREASLRRYSQASLE